MLEHGNPREEVAKCGATGCCIVDEEIQLTAQALADVGHQRFGQLELLLSFLGGKRFSIHRRFDDELLDVLPDRTAQQAIADDLNLVTRTLHQQLAQWSSGRLQLERRV